MILYQREDFKDSKYASNSIFLKMSVKKVVSPAAATEFDLILSENDFFLTIFPYYFKLKNRGVVCRESNDECDLPEECTGETGQCPIDVYKKNGTPCSNNGGYCFNGSCPALDLQCEQVWGYGGVAAGDQCFEQFNSKGSINGHCGTDASGHYVKCEPE